MHCLLTKPETQAEKLQAGSVLQLLHTSITFFRGDVVSCFPSFLNLNVGFGTYVMQQVNNGLFLLYSKALFPHKYHQEIICLAPKSLLLLFYSMFSLLGSVRHHNISVKKNIFKNSSSVVQGAVGKNSPWTVISTQWSIRLYFVVQTRSSPHYLRLYKHIKKQSAT